MTTQSGNRFSSPTPDPRVKRAARAALSLIESLEPRRLLAAVAAEEPKYNFSGNDHRLLTSVPFDSVVRHMKHTARAGKTGSAPAGAQPILAAAESGGTPTISAIATDPQTYSGTLNGKIVFTSAGHGWKGSGTSYTTDRPEYWRQTDVNNNVIDDGEIVEDFGNQDQLTFYADYLLRAGATVVPMRPVGRQLNEIVLDNDSPGVTYTGTWNDSTDPVAAARFYDEDYGAVADFVRYRNAGTTPGSDNNVATYTPNIPVNGAGFYPVYTWVARGTNRTTQLYRINHTGGSTEIRVDHSKVGLGWVYLGTYHFNSGSSSTLGSVQISSDGPASKVVIADAIRFGNGMGDWIEPGATVISGKPREDENSEHWINRMLGQGTSAATAGITDNVNAPSNMAEWMFQGTYNPAGGVVDAVYIGFHSNGTTGDPDTATGRGARGLIEADVPEQTPHQTGTNGLAPILGNQINQDFQNLNGVFEVNWTAGTTATGTNDYGEINLGSGAEMDATIIEVAFHDNVQDNLLLRDPKVRDQIARSVYQGTLQYFSAWGGATNTSLPTPPTNLRAVSNSSGEVTLNWSAGPSSPASVYGAAATAYKVYASVDGRGFDGGTAVAGGGTTSVTLSGFAANTPYYFKVAATNAGGESRPSEVVTALASGGVKQVLIVNGFDRFDRTQNFRYPFAGGDPDGLADRVWSRYNNSFDYVVQVHTAINTAQPGVHVASTSNEAVISGAVNLTDYDTVIWILGEESTVNDTFDATEQTKVTQFLAAGGNLFLSGAEIAWDLDQQNNGRTFFENTLKGNFVSDDAGTYTATANAGGIFAGLSSFAFSQGNAFSSLDSQVYNVDTPDVISPLGGAISALSYSGGTGGTAAIQYGPGGVGSGSIVMFGFPFEAMTNATRRQQAMDRILDFFGMAAPVSIAGQVFRDNNGNGVFDAGEPTMNGVQVTLSGDGSGSVLTSGSGNYSFTGLASGTYTVTETIPGGFVATTATSIPLTVSASDVTGQNFGNFATSYSGTSGNDAYTLSKSGANTVIVENGTTYQIATATLPNLTFSPGSGDDQITIDYTNGSPIPSGGMTFNGGGQSTAAGDRIYMTGSGGNDTFSISATQITGSTINYGTAEGVAFDLGGGDDVLNFNGPVTPAVTFNGGTGSDTLNVNSGTFTFPTDASLESANLTVNANGGDVTFATTQHLAALNLGAGGTATLATGGDKYLHTRGLHIDGGLLQLNDNDLIVDYAVGESSPEFALRDHVKSIYLGGTTGISYAPGAGNVAIAIAEKTEWGFSVFNGETLDDTTVIGKYTYYGDANLDGKVTSDDYVAVDVGLGSGDSWVQGDFNFSGTVTSDDYVAIDVNLGSGVGAPL